MLQELWLGAAGTAGDLFRQTEKPVQGRGVPVQTQTSYRGKMQHSALLQASGYTRFLAFYMLLTLPVIVIAFSELCVHIFYTWIHSVFTYDTWSQIFFIDFFRVFQWVWSKFLFLYWYEQRCPACRTQQVTITPFMASCRTPRILH